MTRKNLPYLFLLLLIIVIIFLGGVKYGQKVEETNKVIKYVLSITPTKIPPTPVPSKSISFVKFESKRCGISFLYPDNLIDKELKYLYDDALLLGTSPDILDQKSDRIRFQCMNKTNEDYDEIYFSAEDLINNGDSTISAKLKEKSITLFEKNSQYTFKLVHPKTGGLFFMKLDKNLFPLVAQTIEFTLPTIVDSDRPTPTKKPTVTSILSP